MGLLARVLEAAGIATVCLSTMPDLTTATGAPRVAAVARPLARPLGEAGDANGQRAVLRAALLLLETAREPGACTVLPFPFIGPPRAARDRVSPPPPISQLIKRRPWLLANLITGDIPAG